MRAVNQIQMSIISYEIQKLGEAVSVLASRDGSMQKRLEGALVPLLVLQTFKRVSGEARSAELDRVCSSLANGNAVGLSNEDASRIATAIADLHSSLWYAAAWELEDQIDLLRAESNFGPAEQAAQSLDLPVPFAAAA